MSLSTSAMVDDVASGLNLTFYVFCAVVAVLKPVGLALAESGQLAPRDVRQSSLKSVHVFCAAGLAFWASGYAIAFSDVTNKIAGSDVALMIRSDYRGEGLDAGVFVPGEGAGYLHFFLHLTFAATAVSIMSSGAASCGLMSCHVWSSVVFAGLVYPTAAHWQWGGGATSDMDDGKGAIDFGGSSIVHMAGGLAAIIGAGTIGARNGRFEGRTLGVTEMPMPKYSLISSSVGALLVWLGTYGGHLGLCPGGLVGNATTVNRVVINTTLAPAASAIVSMVVAFLVPIRGEGRASTVLEATISGMLAGISAIGAGAADISPVGALLTGCGAAFVWRTTSWLQRQFLLDDVTDAGPVHFWSGVWGVMALSIFSDGDDTTGLTGQSGVFHGGSELVLYQAGLCSSVSAWVSFMMITSFGLLRVTGQGRDLTEDDES